jgi:hypothetical protein
MKYYFIFVYLFSTELAFADLSEDGFFAGRISRINEAISTVRVKVDFDNIKYLNPKDKIQFWDERNLNQKCNGIILGRSADYLLVKVSQLKYCENYLHFTTGAYFKFFSEDLVNNISMGKDVIGILIKKRLAVQGQIDSKTKEISAQIERSNAVNDRYMILREKLEAEWKKELQALEVDKIAATHLLKELNQHRDDIDQKMELYKVKDENLTVDRWSLDSRLYFKK